MYYIVASPAVAVDAGLVRNTQAAVFEGRRGLTVPALLGRVLVGLVAAPAAPLAKVILEVLIGGDDLEIAVDHRHAERHHLKQPARQQAVEFGL